MSPVQIEPVGDDPLHLVAQGSRPQAGLPGTERIAEGKVRTGAGSPESALSEDGAAPLEDRLPPGDHPFQVFSAAGTRSGLEPGAPARTAARVAADRRNSPIPPGLSPYHGPKAERSSSARTRIPSEGK